MACEIKELEFENYGNCLSVSNGMIEAVVTIDVGPRIIYFGFIGGENVLYNDLNREYRRAEPILQEHYGENAQYFAYGGHRLWTSPERMPESYYPDNKPVIYAILPESVSFTQPPQEENGLALTMEIMMSDNAKDMMVVHSAQNFSKGFYAGGPFRLHDAPSWRNPDHSSEFNRGKPIYSQQKLCLLALYPSQRQPDRF